MFKKMFSKAAEMASHSGLSKKPSEMRIILLGPKGSGKSSSGNTILGSEQFSLERTAQCEKRQGDVGGRQVTVVDTPGWFYDDSLNKTSELIKQDIVLSASLCPKGPDALLLVIRADCSRKADWYKNMEEHVQLLSQRVWSHTMILFTRGDCLYGKSIEQYIESEGESLQRLVKKCGNRYHVFNNKNRSDDTQVTQLLDKIQEMAGEKGGCFEIDRRVLEETEKKRRTQDEGAARRQMKVKKERESIRSKMGDDLHLSEMRIILLGHINSGKSSSGNTILGSEQFSLERTAQCEKRQGDVAGRQVTVVNTPGWWKEDPLNETSELTKQQIALSASLCPPGPDALLLVIGTDSSCTADECKNMEEHMQILSQRVWSHTMILFTKIDGKSIEQYIESEGEGLQRLVEKCGNRYHVFNNKNRGDDTQVTELLLKIEEMDHYGTGRPATPDTKPKAVKNSPVPAQSKGTASCVSETSLFLGVTQTTTIKDSKGQDQKVTQDQQDQSDQVEKLTALLKERERELQNTITAMEDSKREQLKLTQEQRDQAEKLSVQMKEKENTIKEMKDSKGQEQKRIQEQQSLSNQVQKLTVQMKEKEDTIKEMEDSKRELQKLTQEQRDQAEKLSVQMKEKEDTIQEMKDSKSQEQKLIQEQRDQAEKLSVQMKEKEDTIKDMEDSKRALQKLTQDQRDQAEKLSVQMKEKEDTIKEMEDSKTREQKLIQEQQDQRDHAEKLTVQMEEMKSELEKISQRQMEADEKRASATPPHLTQITGAEDKLKSVRRVFIQRVSDPILNELLDELLDNDVITDEEMGTAMGEKLTPNKARSVIDMVRRKGNKASSFMIDMIDQLDRNLSDVLQLKLPPTN